jgi:hypothetical protein
LHHADQCWERFGPFGRNEQQSYLISRLDMLRQVAPLALRPLRDLSIVERQALFGDETDQFPSAGWLGNLSQAAEARHNLIQDDQVSRDVQTAVSSALLHMPQGHTSAALNAIGEAFRALLAIHRVGPGVTTRYLTLRRPDACVSVNAASQPSLMRMLGVPQLQEWSGYEAGLTKLWGAPWMKAPSPKDCFERWIWEYRAALLDALAYRPLNGRHPDHSWT